MDSEQEDWKDILSRRLITRVEPRGDELVKQDQENIDTIDRAGEFALTDAVREETAQKEIGRPQEAGALDARLTSTTFAKIEKSLISLGFFTPSSRRIKDQKVKRINFTREIDGKRVEATAEFHPSAIFGLPITADQDKYLALHDIITNLLRADGKITNPIRFTSADLLRLLNKRVRTGKNYKDICEWLDVMTATTIVSNGVVYEAGKKRFARDRFHVFDRAVSVGKELPDGSTADANYVWLSEWQLENINNNFLLPIDLVTYRELKNHITKALVPLLQIWLFASQKKGSFEKRYDELCEMLSLQNYQTPSQILRQFKPSLDELTRYEYLEKWRIEKTTDRKAYKIVFFHGPKFHRDRRRRLDQKNQSEISIVIAQSEPIEPGLPEPGKLESLSAAGPGGGATAEAPQPIAPVEKLATALSTRGLSKTPTVKLLASLPSDRLQAVTDYIDYWDSIPAEKRGPGLLHSLIQNNDPLPESFETRTQREAREAAAEKTRKLYMVKQALETAYDEYQRQELDRYIAEEFPKEEYTRLFEAHKIEIAQQPGIWNKNLPPETKADMAHGAARREIAKRLTVLPYEEFCRRETPRLLAEYGITPGEFGREPGPPGPKAD